MNDVTWPNLQFFLFLFDRHQNDDVLPSREFDAATITHKTLILYITKGKNQWASLQIRQGGGGMLSEGEYGTATIREGWNSILPVPIPGFAKIQKEVIDASSKRAIQNPMDS